MFWAFFLGFAAGTHDPHSFSNICEFNSFGNTLFILGQNSRRHLLVQEKKDGRSSSGNLFPLFRKKRNKTGVLNDPLGQPTVPADCCLILKFWDGRTEGHSVWK